MVDKKKILVICSRNQSRSLTAETIFRGHPDLQIRSAGTSPSARHQVSIKDIEWADIILCMEDKHRDLLIKMFGRESLPQIKVVQIDDSYEYMNSGLVELLKDEILLLS